jgi:acetyl esterase/lipase
MMTLFRAGVIALALPLLMAAAPVKTAPKPVAKTSAAKAALKSVHAEPAPAAKTQAADSAKDYPLPSVAFPGGVTMTERVYSTPKGFRPLTLDLYQPSGKSYPRPGLIFVHGGGWNSGDSRHAGTFGDFPGLLASLAARGFVVASVNYRLSGEARFPAALQDVKSAISWLRRHAKDYNLDDTRIAIWGASAGGQIAAMAGVACGVAALEPPQAGDEKPASDCVQAVIDWYGVSDFETLHGDFDKPAPDKSEEGDYLGCEPALCPAEVAKNASPLAYIEPMSPPFLIQHGADDVTVSPKQSQKLYDALHDKNVPAELVIYPGVAHGFAKSGGGDTPVADTAVNREAVEKLEAFLDITFPKPAPAQAKPAKAPPKPKGLPY